MSKRKIPAGRRRARKASSGRAARPDSPDATTAMTFTGLPEAQWEGIRATHDDWPEGTDWRGEIEKVGREFWEARAERQAWLEKFRGEKPKTAKERVERALSLICQLQKTWAESSLDDTDLPDPGLKLRERLAERWLDRYDIWVTPFQGQRDPMRNHLDWILIMIWVSAGGELSYSRKNYEPGTPADAPLIDFLTRALEAILGKTYRPSTIAKKIDHQRDEIANAKGMARRRRGGRFA